MRGKGIPYWQMVIAGCRCSMPQEHVVQQLRVMFRDEMRVGFKFV
jgi:hypothetical protein